jgi:tetratricopeptide (TPR) repeat protein
MYRVAWDLVFGTEAQRANAIAQVDSIPPYTARQLFNAIRHPTDGDLRAAVLPRLIERDLPPFPYAEVLVASSLEQGRVDTALAQMRRWPLNPFSSACLPAVSLSLGVPLPDSTLRTHLEPSRLGADASPRQYMCAGIYLVERGRSDELPALFDRLRAAGTEHGRSTAAIQRLVDELKGYRAFRAGNWARADTLWAGQQESDRWGAIWRGDLHRKRGRLREAEDWYQAAWRHPVAHERLGRLYEQMDEPKKARAAYQRFIEAWKNADPALQDRVQAARQRLTDT